MTGTRFFMTVPAGTSFLFAHPDGICLDQPIVGLIERTIELDSRI